MKRHFLTSDLFRLGPELNPVAHSLPLLGTVYGYGYGYNVLGLSHVSPSRPNLRTIEFTKNVSLFDRSIATSPTRKHSKDSHFRRVRVTASFGPYSRPYSSLWAIQLPLNHIEGHTAPFEPYRRSYNFLWAISKVIQLLLGHIEGHTASFGPDSRPYSRPYSRS